MKKENAGSERLVEGQPRPTFLIAGVAKSGTTSLYEYLRQHPQIFMPDEKEPCYFVPEGYGIKTWDDYLALFAPAKAGQVAGESSAVYTSTEGSLEWIKRVLGDVRLIVILRQPAKRAFSQYGWMVREGYEDAPTFAEALRREPTRLQDAGFRADCPQFFGDYLYFNTGLYAGQIRHCYETFGRERVKVYLFEDLVREPLKVCREVFGFLGVTDDFVPNLEVHNEGRIPKSVGWQYWLRGETRRKRLIGSRSLRGKMANALMDWNAQMGTKPRPDASLMRELTERYRPDIEQLQELLGRDLSAWLKMES